MAGRWRPLWLSLGLLAQVLWCSHTFVRLWNEGCRSPGLRKVRQFAVTSPVFSEEAWSDDMSSEMKVQDLQEGQALSGIVVRVVEELGCFVDVGADKQGLVHATQVQRGYTPVLSEVVQPGQMVKVWVKAVSPEGRLDLTMVDESQEDENMAPFKEVPKDQWLDGQIAGLHNGGAFATVFGPNGEGPIEGYIPISQIQDGFLEHPADVLEPGQSVRVRVVKTEGRLTLSMRKFSARLRAEDQDVSSLLEVSPSDWFTGRVDHAAPYGVFVEMDLPEEDGKVVGLVHISEIREGRVGDPAAEVEEGQEVKVRILTVDKSTGRISMSMKPVPVY